MWYNTDMSTDTDVEAPRPAGCRLPWTVATLCVLALCGGGYFAYTEIVSARAEMESARAESELMRKAVAAGRSEADGLAGRMAALQREVEQLQDERKKFESLQAHLEARFKEESDRQQAESAARLDAAEKELRTIQLALAAAKAKVQELQATAVEPVPVVSVPKEPEQPAGPKAGEVKRLTLPGGAALELVYCPPGEFPMGSAEGDSEREEDEVHHRVTLTKGFWIGKYEVSQEQWTSVMEGNPSRFKGEACPVDSVSWEDCQAFLKKAGQGLRLPTEAEWEYACRAGEPEFAKDSLDAVCWYDGYGTHPIGRKLPNAWGVHDMLGNVWEWCQDRYGPYAGTVCDPTGPDLGESRVLRGGSWACYASNCRPADRGCAMPDMRNSNGGFRVALTAE